MSACLPTGVLTISIDVDADAAHAGLVERRSLDRVVGMLLDLLGECRMRATWALNDPAVCAAVDRIVRARAGHEIAILADSTWVGPEVSRSHFALELAHRINRAHAAGSPVSTLALRTVPQEGHLCLAIRHGITAVRHAVAAGGRNSHPAPPRTLPFGVWSFPVVLRLPGLSRWRLGGGGGRTARGTVDQAISNRGLVQLVIDAPRLAAGGASAERVVKRVLRHVDHRRRHGMLDVESIGAVVLRLRERYQGQPSRSILHSAA